MVVIVNDSKKQLTIKQTPGIVLPLQPERPWRGPVYSDIMHQAASIRLKSTTCNILYYSRPAQVMISEICSFLIVYLLSSLPQPISSQH